jgi:flagellin
MGSFSILHNISTIFAQNQLRSTSIGLNQTINRLSSGKRINSGADDAAGLMIADTLRGNASALGQAVRNANDCISVGQIADGALQEISNILTRSVTLAEEAATETVDNTGRGCLNAEFDQIEAEIARIAEQTNYNGVKIFTNTGINGALSVFVGDLFTVSSISVSISMIGTDATPTTTGTQVLNIGGYNLALVDLSSQASAATSLATIKNALIAAANMRATIGAGSNRLQSAVQVMQSQALNTTAAESTIRDANMAEEISNLTKFQILSQSGMAALSQANSQSQSVLSLLRSMG